MYSGVYQSRRWRSVAMAPGRTALTRMLCGTEFVGQGAGEPDDGGLGGDVEGDAGGRNHPGNGGHVDDGAATGGAHGRQHGLDGEELGAEVDGDGVSKNSGVTSSIEWR